jgi:polar amino acid transport system substrate-binding protein
MFTRNLIAIFCIFIPFQTISATEVTVNIVTEELIPFSYFDADENKVKGYYTQLIRAVMKEANIDYQITMLPWARAIREVSSQPNTLIYVIGRIPSRENNFIWLHKIRDVDYHLYTLKQNSDLITAGPEQLKNLSVAVGKNDVNYTYLKRQNYKKLVIVHDYDQMLNLLRRKRVDLIAANDLPIEGYFSEVPKQKVDIVAVEGYEVPAIGIYFALNPNSNIDIVNKLQNSFQTLIKNGTYHKILAPVLN